MLRGADERAGREPETGAADRAKQRNEKRTLIHARLLAQIDNCDAVDRDGLRVGEAEGLEGVSNDHERRGRLIPGRGVGNEQSHVRDTLAPQACRWIKAVRGADRAVLGQQRRRRDAIEHREAPLASPVQIHSRDRRRQSRVALDAGIRDLVGLADEMRFQSQAVRVQLVRNEAARRLIMDDPDRRSAII